MIIFILYLINKILIKYFLICMINFIIKIIKFEFKYIKEFLYYKYYIIWNQITIIMKKKKIKNLKN